MVISTLATVKTNKLVYLQSLLNYVLFLSKTNAESCLKNHEDESILYNSTELSVDWTSRELQNQTVLFSRKIKCSV